MTPFVNLYKKTKVKDLLLLLPLDRENLTSFLSPILGQFGIKNSDFITVFIAEFNRLSDNVYAEEFKECQEDPNGSLLESLDLVVPLHVVVYRGGKFEIHIKPPTVHFLFDDLYEPIRFNYRILGKKRHLNIPELYRVAAMKSAAPSTREISGNYKVIRDSYILRNV